MRLGKARPRNERMHTMVSNGIAETLQSRKLARGTIGKLRLRIANIQRQCGIVIVRKVGKGKHRDKTVWMGHEDIAELAFGRHASLGKASLVAVWNISTTWAGYLQTFAADAFLNCLQKVMDRFVSLATTHRPAFVLSRTAWDETSQRLVLPISGTEARSAWQVMVARMRIKVGFGPDLKQCRR